MITTEKISTADRRRNVRFLSIIWSFALAHYRKPNHNHHPLSEIFGVNPLFHAADTIFNGRPALGVFFSFFFLVPWFSGGERADAAAAGARVRAGAQHPERVESLQNGQPPGARPGARLQFRLRGAVARSRRLGAAARSRSRRLAVAHSGGTQVPSSPRSRLGFPSTGSPFIGYRRLSLDAVPTFMGLRGNSLSVSDLLASTQFLFEVHFGLSGSTGFRLDPRNLSHSGSHREWEEKQLPLKFSRNHNLKKSTLKQWR